MHYENNLYVEGGREIKKRVDIETKSCESLTQILFYLIKSSLKNIDLLYYSLAYFDVCCCVIWYVCNHYTAGSGKGVKW